MEMAIKTKLGWQPNLKFPAGKIVVGTFFLQHEFIY